MILLKRCNREYCLVGFNPCGPLEINRCFGVTSTQSSRSTNVPSKISVWKQVGSRYFTLAAWSAYSSTLKTGEIISFNELRTRLPIHRRQYAFVVVVVYWDVKPSGKVASYVPSSWLIAWHSPQSFFFSFVGWVETVHLERRPLLGLLYQPRMIVDDKCGVVCAIIYSGNKIIQRKPAPVKLCPPEITRDRTRARTWMAQMEGLRLISWTKTRPYEPLIWRLYFTAKYLWILTGLQAVKSYIIVLFILRLCENKMLKRMKCTNTGKCYVK
jgi:hypothetical protein